MQVTVYRSSVKDGLYVYVGNEMTLEALPQPVLKQLGAPEKALEFDLQANRTLPNADTSEVMEAISSQGFYVQMPADIETVLERLSNGNLASGKTTKN